MIVYTLGFFSTALTFGTSCDNNEQSVQLFSIAKSEKKFMRRTK